MKQSKPDKTQRIATLERKLKESVGSQPYALHFAKLGIMDANRKKTMGSGILVTLNYIGGKEVCLPFVVKDGFSDETIAALRAELEYSFARAIEFKP